ncbi:hypothetical protein [Streptomyces sp. NPDC086023]|uniref:hypothetical protein n=1 Tax=Streptomyces sp. NPDC086023 TaxID=3365746 RepID=UPI0037CD842B
MIRSVLPSRSPRRNRLRTAVVAASLFTSFAVPATVAANAAALQTCTTANVLAGSHFEIDVNANLIVNGANCIDWLSGGTGTAFRSGVIVKNDRPSGRNDNSFGQGSKEDDPNPTIVFGSIPPNKSDLLNFGVFTEADTTPKFLELFWRRINSPQGTTNMDFELNQKFCSPNATPTNCANNGPSETATPVRTQGDKLITYDLSQGGTVPTISIRTWSGTAWGGPTVITGGSNPLAVGSVNSSTIPANQAGSLGQLDPFTFGEAAISFDAIFPPGSACTTFGSAYVKSRSSDSFNSELKDFIDPTPVQITNCASLITTASGPVTVGSAISDTAVLGGVSANAGGTLTFRAYSDAQCTNQVFTGGSVETVNGPGTYHSPEFTPTAVGSYYWTASYSGDANNSPAATSCGDANETSVVDKARPTLTTVLSDETVTIGDSVTDSATLNGASANAGGTVTYTVYTDMACTQGARAAGTVNVTNGVIPDSNSLQFNTVGTFYWQAVYSGDANNEAAMSLCASEQLVVGRAGATVATAQEFFPQDSVTVSASAGGTPTGTVTFRLFGPGDLTCSAPVPAYEEENVPLVNGQAATNNTTFSIDTANDGDYAWRVIYSGDANHEPAASPCATEHSTLEVIDHP